MPKTKLLQDSPDGTADVVVSPAQVMCATADALYRAAVECCRQHQRYARLVEAGVLDDEQRDAAAVVEAADAVLAEAMRRYEEAARRPDGASPDQAFRCGNGLWLAAREFLRRNDVASKVSRRLADHSPARFAEVAVDFDLAASALLNLQQCLDAYRKTRPDAELRGGTPAGGAER